MAMDENGEFFLGEMLKVYGKALGDDIGPGGRDMPGLENGCTVVLNDGTAVGVAAGYSVLVRSYLMFGVLLEMWRFDDGEAVLAEKRFVPYSRIAHISEVQDKNH